MNGKKVCNGWYAVALVCLAGLPLRLWGAGPEPDFSKLRRVPAAPGLAELARTNHITLEGIEPCADGQTLRVGDSISGIITLFEKGGKRTQWLLFLEATLPDPKTPASKPPTVPTWYSVLGNKLEFVSSPAWVSLRTVGPFAAAPPTAKPLKVKDQKDRFTLDQAALSLGMDRGAEALMRLKPEELKRLFNLRDKPFTEAEIRENRKALTSPEAAQQDQRVLVGSIAAMLSYFGIVQHTEGLEDLFYQMIDRPSLWSILRHGIRVSLGFKPEWVRAADPAAWGLPPGTPAYYLPMTVEINDKLALTLTLVVTTPRPPLLACGGVVGVLVQKPSDPEHYLTLLLVNAHRAAAL